MAFARRRLAIGRKLSDEQLLLEFMRGERTREDVERYSRFLLVAASHPKASPIGDTARKLWKTHGARLLATVGDDPMPERLELFLRAYGRPDKTRKEID